jgi:leader peptidase (prepilin peptidase)/N-methyltransferase
MVLMIIVILGVIGLCAGSFVNALVWRLHEQETRPKGKTDKTYAARLSISRGRSMCPRCKHELAARDLLPVLSWIGLGGKCRYCREPISAQYPLVELATAALFIGSYIWWPAAFEPSQTALLVLWLGFLTGLMALLVYDLRWLLLPDRLVYPLSGLAAVQAAVVVMAAHHPLAAFLNAVGAVVAGGGLFYLLFQVSDGKWIGGGDVKLGCVLGLVAGTPARSFLFIFIASILGSLVSLPLLATHRLKRESMIPFGPFLIVALIIVQLFGADILHWYRQTFITF